MPHPSYSFFWQTLGDGRWLHSTTRGWKWTLCVVHLRTGRVVVIQNSITYFASCLSVVFQLKVFLHRALFWPLHVCIGFFFFSSLCRHWRLYCFRAVWFRRGSVLRPFAGWRDIKLPFQCIHRKLPCNRTQVPPPSFIVIDPLHQPACLHPQWAGRIRYSLDMQTNVNASVRTQRRR